MEIRHGFGTSGIRNIYGFWDENLYWQNGEFRLQKWMDGAIKPLEKQGIER